MRRYYDTESSAFKDATFWKIVHSALSPREKKHTQYFVSKWCSACLQYYHSSSPQCQQDSKQGQLRTLTHSCFLATLSKRVALLKTSTASHNSCTSQLRRLSNVRICVCVYLSLCTYLWSEGSRPKVTYAAGTGRRMMIHMENAERKIKTQSILLRSIRKEHADNRFRKIHNKLTKVTMTNAGCLYTGAIHQTGLL